MIAPPTDELLARRVHAALDAPRDLEVARPREDVAGHGAGDPHALAGHEEVAVDAAVDVDLVGRSGERARDRLLGGHAQRVLGVADLRARRRGPRRRCAQHQERRPETPREGGHAERRDAGDARGRREGDDQLDQTGRAAAHEEEEVEGHRVHPGERERRAARAAEPGERECDRAERDQEADREAPAGRRLVGRVGSAAACAPRASTSRRPSTCARHFLQRTRCTSASRRSSGSRPPAAYAASTSGSGQLTSPRRSRRGR